MAVGRETTAVGGYAVPLMEGLTTRQSSNTDFIVRHSTLHGTPSSPVPRTMNDTPIALP